MPKKKETQPQPKCSRCGSYKFKVEGFVGYRQYYDAELDDWSSSEIFWEVDYPENAWCRDCGYEAKAVLKKTGVLAEYYKIARAR